jgi:ribosomal protein S18 acetylase RimI-like enzyme
VTSEPLPVLGLFETHLTVSDLERSVAFYRDVVGLPLALELPGRGAAFFWAAEPGEAMLGLWSLGSAPIALSSHIAFRTTLDDVMDACERLRSLDVTPLSFFARETSEPSVIGWMPAAAVYFRDPDGHLLEYLAMVDEPARPELGIVPWSQWATGGDAPASHVRVERYSGPRAQLRELFAMAEDSASRLDSYLEAGDVLVAVAGGRIVGHVQLVDSADTWESEIRNIAVEPSQRGCGIGRRLLDAAVDVARARHRRRLVVATAAADIDNLRFYQRAGFRLHSIERDAFTESDGYPRHATADGIDVRDRVWLELAVAAEMR